MCRYVLVVTLAAWAVQVPVRLDAQQSKGTIRGVVMVSKERRPIEGARINLVGMDAVTVTDARGTFLFEDLIPGRYVIQASAIGFTQLTSPVVLRSSQTLNIEFLADAEAVELPEVSVREMANNGPVDWIRRKAEGRGRYISRADIESRNAATVPDMMRMLAGVRVECRNAVQCSVRMARSPRGCNPAFFMDGIPSDPAIVWLTPVGEIEGIEVYSGPAETPPELESAQARCGVIAIWTRSPPPRRPKQPQMRPAELPAPVVRDTVETGLRELGAP